MSAIAGILSFGAGRQDPAAIHALGAALRHRGPDGQGHHVDGRVSLAHCALRATPEAHGETQPLHDAESGCTLVFDGRLDNRADMIAALGLPADQREAPDAVLVMAGYKQWGTGLPRHLLGDFAFAVWDAVRERLFCARDPVGAAGFSFFHSRRFFAFASESEALAAALPEVGSEPNENYIACLFVPQFQNLADRRTWLRDVQALLPGESLQVLPDGNIRIERYWEPASTAPRTYDSYADCEAHFLSVFGQALRDRLRGSGDFAVMLSGGLDSAGIMAMSQRLAPEYPGRQCHAYSAIADDPASCIESRSIVSLARSTGARLHTVSVPSFEGMLSATDLAEVAWNRPHPVANSIVLPALMCLAASRDGHKFVLHGASGDVVMNAPMYYPALHLRRGRALAAWRECRAASANNLFLQGRPPLHIFLHSLARALAPAPAKHWWRVARFKRQPAPGAGSLLNAAFAARIRLDEQLAEEFCQDEARRCADALGFRTTKSIRAVCSGLSGAGQVAGRSGIEARDPWSDLRVIDFFLRMPETFKVQDGWTKFPVRSAFREEIEPFVRQRKDKTHLGWKLTYRLLDELNGYLAQEIDRDLAVIEPYVDVPAFLGQTRALVEHRDHSHFDSIYDVVTLLFWLKRMKKL